MLIQSAQFSRMLNEFICFVCGLFCIEWLFVTLKIRSEIGFCIVNINDDLTAQNNNEKLKKLEELLKLETKC